MEGGERMKTLKPYIYAVAGIILMLCFVYFLGWAWFSSKPCLVWLCSHLNEEYFPVGLLILFFGGLLIVGIICLVKIFTGSEDFSGGGL